MAGTTVQATILCSDNLILFIVLVSLINNSNIGYHFTTEDFGPSLL